MSHEEQPPTIPPAAQPTAPTSLWPGLGDAGHSAAYVARFREMRERGQDILGEARLVDALAPRGARILDAGSGPGRHGGHLATLGHRVVGVDVDPALIAAAREDHPDATWHVVDLARLDLAALGESEPFDVVLVAGNVMDFITSPYRADVVHRLADSLADDGRLVIGCRVGRGYTPAELDTALPAAGLRLEHRFSTWDLRPWTPGSDFAVSVLVRG
ncbi:MAG: class I SAM-dependent methyltransferase [Micrococcales bacterium]|nr:class I SAM-dependent methyltransferase [Micrococcales bacterium]